MEEITNEQIRRAREMRKRQATYTNAPNFINPEKPHIGTVFAHDLPNYIAKYKATRDPAYSLIVMSLLSKLIIKMIKQEVAKHKVLNSMPLQELYHEAFICLHRAMLTFDISKSSIYSFPRFFQGYLQYEIRKEARTRGQLVCCGVEAAAFEGTEGKACYNAERTKHRLLIKMAVEDKIKELVATGEVRQADMDMFRQKAAQGYSYQAIAEVHKMTPKAVERRVSKVLDKLKHALRKLRYV